MASVAFLNILIAIRITHAIAHLLFPFEVLDFTKEALQDCRSIEQLKVREGSGTCVFLMSTYAQTSIANLSWVMLLFYYKGNESLKSKFFAFGCMMISLVDSWTCLSLDKDPFMTIEPIFSQYLAIASILACGLLANYNISNANHTKESPTLFYSISDGWFFCMCFLKFLLSFNLMSSPLDVMKIHLVTEWKSPETFVLARYLALNAVNNGILCLILLTSPTSERGRFFPYVLLLSNQVFSYFIDRMIQSRMPNSLPMEQLLKGHEVFVLAMTFGLLLLLTAWRRGTPSPASKIAAKKE
jgi:hypothetical protein